VCDVDSWFIKPFWKNGMMTKCTGGDSLLVVMDVAEETF
jgi:hypothetical protein